MSKSRIRAGRLGWVFVVLLGLGLTGGMLQVEGASAQELKGRGALLFRLRLASFHQSLRADPKAVLSGNGVYQYPFVDYVNLLSKHSLDHSVFINFDDIREDKRQAVLSSGVAVLKGSDGGTYVLYPLSRSLEVLRPDRVPALMPIP